MRENESVRSNEDVVFRKYCKKSDYSRGFLELDGRVPVGAELDSINGHNVKVQILKRSCHFLSVGMWQDSSLDFESAVWTYLDLKGRRRMHLHVLQWIIKYDEVRRHTIAARETEIQMAIVDGVYEGSRFYIRRI